MGYGAAPRGRLLFVITATIEHGKITGYEVIADRARLPQLDVAVMD